MGLRHALQHLRERCAAESSPTLLVSIMLGLREGGFALAPEARLDDGVRIPGSDGASSSRHNTFALKQDRLDEFFVGVADGLKMSRSMTVRLVLACVTSVHAQVPRLS